LAASPANLAQLIEIHTNPTINSNEIIIGQSLNSNYFPIKEDENSPQASPANLALVSTIFVIKIISRMIGQFYFDHNYKVSILTQNCNVLN
jgi:hypothetical protein